MVREVDLIRRFENEQIWKSPPDYRHEILAGRPRDLEDVRSILLKSPGLDRDLVARTLGQFDAALAGTDDLASRFEDLWRESRPDSGR